MVAAIVLVIVIIATTGCAATAGNDVAGVKLALEDTRLEVAAVRGDFSLLSAKIDEIRVDVQAFGDVTIGGDGDSIISIVQALGLILAALAYPLGIRPAKHWVLCQRKKRLEIALAEDEQHRRAIKAEAHHVGPDR